MCKDIQHHMVLHKDLHNKGFIGWDQLLSPEQRDSDKIQLSPINLLLRKIRV